MRYFFLMSLVILMAVPALAQDSTTAADQCAPLCEPYETLSIDMMDGLQSCTCDLDNPTRVCCTEGESHPCGDTCLPMNRECHQEEPGRAYLKIVRAKKYTDADTQFIRSKLDEMLGPMRDTISVEIVFVDDIQETASGKTPLVKQKLDMRKFLNV